MTPPDIVITAGLAEVAALAVAEIRHHLSRPPRVRRGGCPLPGWLRVTLEIAQAVALVVAAVTLIPRYPVQVAAYLQADAAFVALIMITGRRIERRRDRQADAGDRDAGLVADPGIAWRRGEHPGNWPGRAQLAVPPDRRRAP